MNEGRDSSVIFDGVLVVINKLLDVFRSVELYDAAIDLPQIAVIGAQSSGKTSVLESFVKREFLPRGTGIVTRRPLELQLSHVDGGEEWAEFAHLKGVKFTDFDKVRSEIIRETERLTGKNKDISNVPIRLSISSPFVPNLTLIDLPGLIRVPVGDQPGDIERQVRRMVLEYIRRETCIILAVSAANTDIANSDALNMAKIVDPDGRRTIGVLTKLDLMDEGTNALSVLQGDVYSLELGFVGVVNRSQADLMKKKSVSDSIEAEKRFFLSHPVYSVISRKLGTEFLAGKLSNILLQHIHAFLPQLKERLRTMASDARSALQSLGVLGDGDHPEESGSTVVLQSISNYSTQFCDLVDGRIDQRENSSLLSSSEGTLSGGARINYIFMEVFGSYLKAMDPCAGLSSDYIRFVIRNSKGTKSSQFVPEAAFEILARSQIMRVKEPALECVELVLDELCKITRSCEKLVERFPVLKERASQFSLQLLREKAVPLREFVSNLVMIEMAYINTSHPDFIHSRLKTGSRLTTSAQDSETSTSDNNRTMPRDFVKEPSKTTGAKNALPKEEDKGIKQFVSRFFGKDEKGEKGIERRTVARQRVGASQQLGHSDFSRISSMKELLSGMKRVGEMSDEERRDVELIRDLLSSYFDIVRKNVQDSVPKAIMHFLVNSAKEDMQSVLVRTLYKAELIEELAQENPDVAAKRENARRILMAAEQGLKITSEV